MRRDGNDVTRASQLHENRGALGLLVIQLDGARCECAHPTGHKVSSVPSVKEKTGRVRDTLSADSGSYAQWSEA